MEREKKLAILRIFQNGTFVDYIQKRASFIFTI